MLDEATMTITLELPPEVEADITAQAKARGLSLDAFLQAIITTQAAALGPVKSAQALSRESEDPDCARLTRSSTQFRSRLE
jgi:hypothetical protein